MEAEAYRPGRKSAWWLLVAGWIVSPLGPLSFALPFLLLPAMWRAVCARARITLAFICLVNPLQIFFVRGVADYFCGRPAFGGMGLPSYEAANVDPEQTSGSEVAEVLIFFDIHDSRPFAIHRISGNPSLRRNAIAAFWK